jgi:hypothetical protein
VSATLPPLIGDERDAVARLAAGPRRNRWGSRRLRPEYDAAGSPLMTILATGADPHSAINLLLWIVLPYVALAIFVGGRVALPLRLPGWTTRSSQLYERRLLRCARCFTSILPSSPAISGPTHPRS